MLIILESNHSAEELDHILTIVKGYGCEPHVLKGLYKTTVNVLGDDIKIDPEDFKKLGGVSEVLSVMKPFRLVGRDFQKNATVIKVKGATFGPNNFVIIGGPCAVESSEQAMRIAKQVKKAGAQVLRGGAYKPRSSPYSFQGMGEEGLKILKQAGDETGLPIVTEALDSMSLNLVYKYADIIQIGTRNMQNFSLLKECGKLDKPVLLKRGMSSTIDEWLQAAEYIMSGGNHDVILCERGIRSFDSRYTRNVVDLSAIPVIHSLSHLPIVVDPSHGTGRRDSVGPMSYAALAVGANSVMIDVHDDPENAKCDGAQALAPEDFSKMIEVLKSMAGAFGKTI